MGSPSGVSRVRLVPARGRDRDGGIIGWLSFALPRGLLVDGVALRRSLAGEYVFSWPARKDRGGRTRHHVRPVDDLSRRAIEGELLAQLEPWLGEAT